MILQILAEHYREQVAIGNPNYAPNGMELKRIHFVLILSNNGSLIDIEKLDNKVCVAKSRERGGKDAPLIANKMWDNIGYVAGYGQDEKQKKASIIQHRSFVELVKAIHYEYPKNRSFKAVYKFYSKSVEQIYNHPLWEDIISKPGHNISFRLIGETLLASQQEEILNDGSASKLGRCVVLGQKTNISHTHPKLHVYGCAPTGAKLVSFTKDSGYDSYMKKGSDNAPTSVEITESYSAALTGLLQPLSNNRIIIGNVTFLFYTLPTTDFSRLFFALFESVPGLSRYEALHRLKNDISNYSDAEFVLMALVPNAARVSVRLNVRCSVANVAANILRFYEELNLDSNFNFSDAMTMLTPVLVLSRGDNVKKLPPQLIVGFVEALVCGTKFPVLVQSELLCRLHEKIDRTFAVYSMLKCYLIRNSKNYITMSLDTRNRNVGYVLGRILAISERAQELSNPNTSFTIRDTFYSTMSVTPSFVFNRLISSTGAFLRRIPKQGTTIFMKMQFGEVMEMLDDRGVPMRLSFDQQSHFAIGYFHQRQSYFKKKESNE